MRILFTFAGGGGHVEPLVPIAAAAEAAGHVVAFAGRPWMVPKVEALGFAAFAAGSDRGLTPMRRPLVAVDVEREMVEFRDGFARAIARERADEILALCAEWQPDLVVWEETDFGAVVVAERLELPHASVLVIAPGSFIRRELISEALDELRAEHGLPPDPTLAMLSRYLVLSPFPASYRDRALPLPSTAYPVRPVLRQPAGDERVPPWLARLDDRRTVYFTLGTVFHVESGDLFARVVAGLRDLPINLIVTVGREIDPEELGPQPANVHVERFIPQSVLLPHCTLVVSHAGSGSVIGALAYGLPMVLIPLGADQPFNAARCEALGLGKVLDPVQLTPDSVRGAVTTVMADVTYRRTAEGVRRDRRPPGTRSCREAAGTACRGETTATRSVSVDGGVRMRGKRVSHGPRQSSGTCEPGSCRARDRSSLNHPQIPHATAGCTTGGQR